MSELCSWHARAAVLSYLQLAVFCNLFLLQSNADVVLHLRNIVLQLLSDDQLEVQLSVGETHFVIYHISADMSRVNQSWIVAECTRFYVLAIWVRKMTVSSGLSDYCCWRLLANKCHLRFWNSQFIGLFQRMWRCVFIGNVWHVSRNASWTCVVMMTAS